MKLFTIFSALMLLACAVSGAAVPTGKKATVSVRIEHQEAVPASTSYVLFLVESSAPTFIAAKAAVDDRLKRFQTEAQAAFPNIGFMVIAAGIGDRDSDSIRNRETPVTPTYAKVLLCKLPPDEAQAVKLLDFGVKAGLTACCVTSLGGAAGAIHYGAEDSAEAEARLLPAAMRKLQAEAEKLAAQKNRKIGKMCDFEKKFFSPQCWPLTFRETVIKLPTELNGTDPGHIPASLTLYAEFELVPKD
ncbi:MAG: hypothetical protein AB7F32_11360 [Victivallaceae bacterium]